MAATSVLKLVVDDREYSASLKDARKGMQDLQEALQSTGKSFSTVDKSIVEYARAMGQMETTSKTAKGKIGEMTQAFIELSQVYGKMTEQEKASPVGQALSESLEQLKQRTVAAKEELANLEGELKPVSTSTQETGGMMEMLKDKLTVNIDAVKLFSLGLQAAKAALDVAKDAFFSNEQLLDEWGRTVESVEGVYKGFLDSLNSGDFSGFISNIHNITQAAREAYDALDELATFNAFNKANVAGARANLTGAIADYREGVGSKDAVSEASTKLIKELQEKQKLQAKAYEKVVAEVAIQRQVKPEDLLKIMQGDYGTFKELKELEYTGRKTRVVSAGGTYASGPIMQTITEAVPANERERLAQAVKRLNDTEIDNFQSIAEAAQMTQVEIENQRKMVARVLNGREKSTTETTKNSGSGTVASKETVYATDSIAAQEKLIADLTKKWREAGAAVRDDYAEQLGYARQKLSEMQGGFDPSRLTKMEGTPMADLAKVDAPTIPVKIEIDTSPLTQLENELKALTEAQQEFGRYAPEVWQSYEKSIEEVKQKIAEFKGSNTLEKDADASKKAFQSAASAIGQVGNALNSIEDPAAKVMGIVAQAIATVASAHAQALNQDGSTKSNIWAFLAAAAASTASMISMISSIHSATGYAEGGVIPGNHFSGDMQWARVNAGEVILNHAQVGQLASELENSGVQNLRLSTSISGEQIRIVLNNNGNRTGRGEYVTSKIG